MNIKLRGIFFIILFYPLAQLSFAQFDNLGINSAWHKGHILLSTNEVVNGYIQNNDKLGLINFKESLDDTESISFQDKSILAMEYLDAELNKIRKFVTLNVNDEETGKQRLILLDILIEFKHFAVVSKIYSVEPAIRKRVNSYTMETYHAKVGYEQFEYLYVVDDDGEIKTLQITSSMEKAKMKPFAKTSRDFIDRDLLKKHIGLKWNEVKDYISQNNLKLNLKSDLLQTLEFYGELENSDQ